MTIQTKQFLLLVLLDIEIAFCFVKPVYCKARKQLVFFIQKDEGKTEIESTYCMQKSRLLTVGTEFHGNRAFVTLEGKEN